MDSGGGAILALIVLVLVAVIIGLCVMGGGVLSDLSSDKVEYKRIERQMELDKMNHEREMYTLRTLHTLEILMVVGAGLFAAACFTAFLLSNMSDKVIAFLQITRME